MIHPHEKHLYESAAMKVLFGGSFDPVHEGHLKTAQALGEELHVPVVSLVPAACSPLKPASTADIHRLAMLQLAIANYPGIDIDDNELQRPPPSFTVDTLQAVRAEAGLNTPLVWVIGADILSQLSRWKNWQALTNLAHLLIVDRPGTEWPHTGPVAEWLVTLPAVSNPDQLQCFPNGRLARMALPPQPFSSTAIREQLYHRGKNATRPEGLPVCVWDYILQHDLYLPGTSPGTGHEAP